MLTYFLGHKIKWGHNPFFKRRWMATKPGRGKDTEAGMKKGIPITSQRQISTIFLNQTTLRLKTKKPCNKTQSKQTSLTGLACALVADSTSVKLKETWEKVCPVLMTQQWRQLTQVSRVKFKCNLKITYDNNGEKYFIFILVLSRNITLHHGRLVYLYLSYSVYKEKRLCSISTWDDYSELVCRQQPDLTVWQPAFQGPAILPAERRKNKESPPRSPQTVIKKTFTGW